MSEPSTMMVVSAAERDLEERDLEERVADPTGTSTPGSSGTSTEATIVEVQSSHPKKKWRFVWIVQEEPMIPMRRVPALSPVQHNLFHCPMAHHATASLRDRAISVLLWTVLGGQHGARGNTG